MNIYSSGANLYSQAARQMETNASNSGTHPTYNTCIFPTDLQYKIISLNNSHSPHVNDIPSTEL